MIVPQLLKPSKTKIISLLLLIVLGVAAFVFFGRPSAQSLQLAEVKRGNVISSVSSSGSLTGKETADLRFRSSGRIAYVNVKAGDSVNAFQTIAGLDTTLLGIDLQQAQNSLRDKQATAEKVEDEVKDNDDDETFAQKATRTAAQAARDSAYDEVRAAQRAIADANIFTPIAGVVTDVPKIAGQNITASDLIAQVVDISEIYFDTDVDEADINKISLGLKADVLLDAYGDQIFHGVVDQILPQIKTTSSGANVVTIRIKLDNHPLNFVNGLSGEALIIMNISENTLTVPIEALREDNTVVVSENKKLVEKKVTTGIISDTEVEIKSGLNEGEKVVLNPPPPGAKLN